MKLVIDDGHAAQTRDIGADGMYLRLPAGWPLARWLSVDIEFSSRGLRLRAVGEVIRLDRGAYQLGVALRLHHKRLFPLR